MTNGSAVVARDVVFAAQDNGNRLVLHALVGEDDRFGFGAFRARAAACQINGAAKDFRALVGEHALRVHEARGFLTAVAQQVIEVERFFAMAYIARGHVHVGALARQVAGQAHE